MAPISETISNVEQQINEALETSRTRFDEGRTRLRSVVDTTVETAEGRVEQSTSLLREQVTAWRERSLEDLGRVSTMAVDSTRAIAERLPTFELPMSDRLPKAEDVATEWFDYAEELLSWQRALTLDLIQAAQADEAAPKRTKAKKAAKTKIEAA